MNYHDGNRGNEGHDPLDKWIHELKPPEPKFSRDSDKFIEGFHRKMLEEKRARAERRKKNLQRGSVVMVVALVFVGFFSFNEVGSDGFDMVVVENASTPGGVVKNEFRGDGFNVLEGETEQDFQEINRAYSAPEGEVVSLEGWEIQGTLHWTVERKYGFGEKSNRINSSPKELSSTLTRTHAQFYFEKWDKYKEKIEAGEIPVTGTRKKGQSERAFAPHSRGYH